MDRDLQQQVLRTDVAGMPLEWIGYQDAVRLIFLGQVSYSLGRTLYRIHGGINARSGIQSVIDVNAIIASYGHHPHTHLFSESYTPPLSNKALFRLFRDMFRGGSPERGMVFRADINAYELG